MVLDVISVGLLTNVLSEIGFRTLDKIKDIKKRELKPKLEKAYFNAIQETEKKFPNSKSFIERVFKNIKVKERLFSLKGGKEDIKKYIFEFANSKKGVRETELKSKEVINHFYESFKSEFIKSPELQELLHKAYLNEIIFLSKSTNEKIEILPLIYKEIKDIRKDMAKLIAEKSIIKKIRGSNFNLGVGAFQLHLYSYSVKDIIEIFNSFYKIEKKIEKEEKTILELSDELEDSNFIRIIFRESLYKVIYPPERAYIFWLKQKLNYVELTCFVGNHYKKEEIISQLKNYVENSRIKEITLDKEITNLLKIYLRNISSLKYNPRIRRIIKRKNIQHIIKGKIGIFIGDPGFLKDRHVKFVIDNLIQPQDNEHADVFTFSGKEVPKIFTKPIDIDFHRDGRIVGFFPRLNLNVEQSRKSIYDFIMKYGKEF